jgi:hypothetical protein
MYFLARKLHRAGLETRLFGYHAGLERFESVRDRLRRQILALPAGAPYVAIGHSLGGLLLRAALGGLPPERLPRHLFMLATPNRPATLARRLRRVLPYRLWNGDAGQMLADAERMDAIPPPPPGVPATIIAGTRGLPARLKLTPFGDQPNDAIVTVEETRLPPAAEGCRLEHLCIRAMHTLIMNHPEVYRIIRERVPDLVRA